MMNKTLIRDKIRQAQGVIVALNACTEAFQTHMYNDGDVTPLKYAMDGLESAIQELNEDIGFCDCCHSVSGSLTSIRFFEKNQTLHVCNDCISCGVGMLYDHLEERRRREYDEERHEETGVAKERT